MGLSFSLPVIVRHDDNASMKRADQGAFCRVRKSCRIAGFCCRGSFCRTNGPDIAPPMGLHSTGPGAPGGECRGACVVLLALCPPEARLVSINLKERVSNRGHRAGCPFT
ncbi:hypothetical protein VT03_18685 [Planctomyces sp. SH-PL14]|nr:hypothetical protein VT03_18685 [Planctomyces sp. SH-PL14]